jgi:proline racemase
VAAVIVVKTIDAHAGGGALRLVVHGFPAPRGKTMTAKREWATRHAAGLRRVLMLEPRGHLGMRGAVLTEPVSQGAHAGLLLMDSGGYDTDVSEAVIATTTIALERGLLMPGGDQTAVVYDTPAGTIRARVKATHSGPAPGEIRVESVTVQSRPSFVLHGGLPLRLRGRQVRVDIAFGGRFCVIVDSESCGVSLDGAHESDLRRAAQEIVQAAEAVVTAAQPDNPALSGITGVVFTGPAHGAGADLRTVSVSATGTVDRSASVPAAAAILAVLDRMGLSPQDRPLVTEGLAGTTLKVRLDGRTLVGAEEALIAEVEGTAWITGEHTFVVDERDPLGEGFLLV